MSAATAEVNGILSPKEEASPVIPEAAEAAAAVDTKTAPQTPQPEFKEPRPPSETRDNKQKNNNRRKSSSSQDRKSSSRERRSSHDRENRRPSLENGERRPSKEQIERQSSQEHDTSKPKESESKRSRTPEVPTITVDEPPTNVTQNSTEVDSNKVEIKVEDKTVIEKNEKNEDSNLDSDVKKLPPTTDDNKPTTPVIMKDPRLADLEYKDGEYDLALQVLQHSMLIVEFTLHPQHGLVLTEISLLQ